MDVDKLKFIVANFVGLKLICLCVAIALHRDFHHKVTKFQLLFWISCFISFAIQGVAGNDPSLAGITIIFSIPAVICVSKVMEYVFDFKSRGQQGVIAFCAVALVLGFACVALGASFPVYTSFFVLAVVVPFIKAIVESLQTKGPFGMSKRFLLIATSLSALNLLDYPFLRLDPSFAPIGFGIAFWTEFMIAISMPATIIDLMQKNYQKQLERDVAIAAKDLLEAHALLKRSESEKSNIVRIVAHDLSNSLAVADFCTSSLERDLKRVEFEHSEAHGPSLSRLVAMLRSALNNQLDLVNSVKIFMTASSGKMKLELAIVNVKGAVSECLQILKEKADQKHLKFIVEMDEQISIRADEAALKNCILLNILSNAVKFSLVGGSITIRSWIDSTAEKVYIEVRDQGVGMSPNKLAAILHDSGHTSSTGTMGEAGSGFGVPIMRSVSQLFHGEVVIRSVQKMHENYDHGTSVRVSFPMF